MSLSKQLEGNMMKKLLLLTALAVGINMSLSYSQETPSPLTYGNIQITLHKGTTTQNEVLEKFGAPNIITNDANNNEVWTYQSHSTQAKSTKGTKYGTLLIAGGAKTSTGFEYSTKTLTLIIKFDPDKRVIDYKSMSTSF